MTGIVPPPLPVLAVPALAARSSPGDGGQPQRFPLPGSQQPAPGAYAGTVRSDPVSGHVLFVGQGLRLVLPPTATGNPPVPVPAVLRVLPERRDGNVMVQLLPQTTSPTASAAVAAMAAPATTPKLAAKPAPRPASAPSTGVPATGNATTAPTPSISSGRGAPPGPLPQIPPPTTHAAGPVAAPSGTAVPSVPPSPPPTAGIAVPPPPGGPPPTSAPPSHPPSSAPSFVAPAPLPTTAPGTTQPAALPAATSAATPATMPPSPVPGTLVSPSPSSPAGGGGAMPGSAPPSMPAPMVQATPVPDRPPQAMAPDRTPLLPVAVTLAPTAATPTAPWQATRWTAGAANPPAEAQPPRPIAFAPPPLSAAPAPREAVHVAERIAGLAGIGAARLGEPAAHKLPALADGLPVSVPAAAFAPKDGAARRIVLGIGEEAPDGPAGPTRRLVLEVDLEHLGRLRLDGLADQGRFDVLMANVPDEVRPGLRALWSLVVQRTGLAGDLEFHDAPHRKDAP